MHHQLTMTLQRGTRILCLIFFHFTSAIEDWRELRGGCGHLYPSDVFLNDHLQSRLILTQLVPVSRPMNHIPVIIEPPLFIVRILSFSTVRIYFYQFLWLSIVNIARSFTVNTKRILRRAIMKMFWIFTTLRKFYRISK